MPLKRKAWVECDGLTGTKRCGSRLELSPLELQPFIKIIDAGWSLDYSKSPQSPRCFCLFCKNQAVERLTR